MEAEAEAIAVAAKRLNSDFTRAVEAIAAHTGKIVVTGIGKSGRVAEKIVATFSSTGTPAVFLHPAEAVHGDLGCIRARRSHRDDFQERHNGGTAPPGSRAARPPVAAHRHSRQPLFAAGFRCGYPAGRVGSRRGRPPQPRADIERRRGHGPRRCPCARRYAGPPVHPRGVRRLPSGRPTRLQPHAGRPAKSCTAESGPPGRGRAIL